MERYESSPLSLALRNIFYAVVVAHSDLPFACWCCTVGPLLDLPLFLPLLRSERWPTVTDNGVRFSVSAKWLFTSLTVGNAFFLSRSFSISQ